MSRNTLTRRQARKKMREQRKVILRFARFGLLALVITLIALFIISSINAKKQVNRMPELMGTKQYFSAPPLFIDIDKQYFARVKMGKGGVFTIQLYADKAPITVNSYIFLARQGYYDGVTFHRVLEGFMAQGGDPTGTGAGGPGYTFENEVSDLEFDKPGVVAMANAGQDTNGSQFFIMFNAYSLSPSEYTIFGQVVEGMDVVNSITLRDPSKSPDYPGDMIDSITIIEGE